MSRSARLIFHQWEHLAPVPKNFALIPEYLATLPEGAKYLFVLGFVTSTESTRADN